MGSIEITTTLVERGPAAAVRLDDQPVARVGEGAKRFPALATVNGYTWRTSVVRKGGEKEYARWISEAKREETRQRRVSQALAMLRDGKKRS